MAGDALRFRRDDARALSRALDALDLQRCPPAGELAQRYFDFYGIDFPALQSAHTLGVMEAGGHRIACHYYHPQGTARGTVFVLHGFLDHVGLFGHMIRLALELGFAVFAFDWPGHGLSSGEPTAIDRFDRYRDVFSDVLERARHDGLPGSWHVLAQSMGGAIAMDYTLHAASRPDAAERHVLPARLFLLAPLVRPAGWHMVRLAYYLRRWFTRSIKRPVPDNSTVPAFLRFLHDQDPLQAWRIDVSWVHALMRWQRDFHDYPPCDVPVTVFQGDDDATVDWRYNLARVREKFPAAEVFMLPGARHHLANEDPELRAHLNAVIRTRLG